MVSYSTLLMNHLPVYLTIQFQEQFYTYVPPSAKKPENYLKTSTGQRITLSYWEILFRSHGGASECVQKKFISDIKAPNNILLYTLYNHYTNKYKTLPGFWPKRIKTRVSLLSCSNYSTLSLIVYGTVL